MSSAQPEYGINEANLIHGEHGVSAERDNTRIGVVATVGVVAVASFMLAALWAGWMYREAHREFNPDGPPPMPSEITTRAYEIGIVNQWEFDVDGRAYQLEGQRAKQVEGYGWVDRGQERIHVPVSSAYRQVQANRGASPVPAAKPAPEGDTQGTPDGAPNQDTPPTP